MTVVATTNSPMARLDRRLPSIEEDDHCQKHGEVTPWTYFATIVASAADSKLRACAGTGARVFRDDSGVSGRAGTRLMARCHRRGADRRVRLSERLVARPSLREHAQDDQGQADRSEQKSECHQPGTPSRSRFQLGQALIGAAFRLCRLQRLCRGEIGRCRAASRLELATADDRWFGFRARGVGAVATHATCRRVRAADDGATGRRGHRPRRRRAAAVPWQRSGVAVICLGGSSPAARRRRSGRPRQVRRRYQ